MNTFRKDIKIIERFKFMWTFHRFLLLWFLIYMIGLNMNTVDYFEKLIKKYLNNEVVTKSDIERQNDLVSNT